MTKKGNLSTALSQFDKRPVAVPDTPPPGKPAPAMSKAEEAQKGEGKTRQPPSRQGKRALTGYFGPEVLRQLKVMAAAEDTTIQALLTEALNDLFKKYGKPHIA
jgi:hypothetical protein